MKQIEFYELLLEVGLNGSQSDLFAKTIIRDVRLAETRAIITEKETINFVRI